ncbi:unnamed protein product [Paramecium octaurelia]|uniref:Protein kinase domain-containing protein n=1 Tax=Paramecium octaurelia TaxID=43137 RepID=A0A8S1VQ64_PAROT|nr:unnamed protein product [Paramecium octaurelia]
MQQIGQFQVTLGKVIGQGANGLIFQAEIDDGKVVALKVSEKITQHEKQILTALKGNKFDHIIEVIAFEQNNNGVYIFMELGQRFELQSQSDKRRLCLEMSKGVSELQKLRFFHRDLKPDNFVIGKDNKIKLIDFGISKTIEQITQTQMQGTYQYMAPEVMAGTDYDPSVDIWSLGILFYEVFTNELFFAKFEGSEMIQIIQNIQQIQINQKISAQNKLEQWQKELLQKILFKNWIKNYSWLNLQKEQVQKKLFKCLKKLKNQLLKNNLNQNKINNKIRLVLNSMTNLIYALVIFFHNQFQTL